MKFVFLVLIALVAVAAGAKLTKVNEATQVAALQKAFAGLHDGTAIKNAMDYVYSPKDQIEMLYSLAQVSDEQLHTFSSKENVAKFRKAMWSLPTWDQIKTKVGDYFSKKAAQVQAAWTTLKQVVSDLGNAHYCKLCGQATDYLASEATEQLNLPWTDAKELVCSAIDWLFDKACSAILTPVLTAAITVSGGPIGALGPKVADAICWVLGEANGYACRHVDLYGKAIADKLAASIPSGVASAAKTLVDAIQVEINKLKGETGKVCKDWTGICPE
jgi:hypothetical protein